MKISAKTKLCIIIGNPVDHSLSPAMHNAAYESIGIDDRFVYCGANVKIENMKQVIEAMRVMNFRGITCTIPHKIEVMKYLDEIDNIAKKIGAVNTVVNEDGILKGYNTDWLGAVIPLEQITEIKNKKVVVIGSGGAARAIVYGITLKGGLVTIYNRTVSKAQELADEFKCIGKGMDEINEIKNSDIIINATSIGMNPLENESPIPKSLITERHIVFDIVYAPYETKLLKTAKAKGATIVHGLEMLLYQGTAQFELYTHHKAPIKIMKNILMQSFSL